MGKAFILMAYGFGWGYYAHAKGIDRKAVALVRELWEETIRSRVAIEMSERDRQLALHFPVLAPDHDWDPTCKTASCPVHGNADLNPHPEGAEKLGIG